MQICLHDTVSHKIIPACSGLAACEKKIIQILYGEEVSRFWGREHIWQIDTSVSRAFIPEIIESSFTTTLLNKENSVLTVGLLRCSVRLCIQRMNDLTLEAVANSVPSGCAANVNIS